MSSFQITQSEVMLADEQNQADLIGQKVTVFLIDDKGISTFETFFVADGQDTNTLAQQRADNWNNRLEIQIFE